ncbi:MAG: sel1 repeat family protein, partial [Candidatus Parabeggiatoa sp.]|nr:sel1 repeat family protein [Candidatus Parabeggiatoa sp.]MEC4584700.1 sel1 repeat family protein [Candidatus Parabeggiatoa sp.]
QQAAQWFHQAAQQGYADAQYNLAVMYYYSENASEETRQEAIKWLRQAAKQGHPKAQAALEKLAAQ